MIIEQKFKTPLFLNDGKGIQKIDCRKWSHGGDDKMIIGKIENNEQEMGYMGSYQIREVWKYAGYFQSENSKKVWQRVPDTDKPQDEIAHIYVSNYGYLAVFTKEEGDKIFSNKKGTDIYEIDKDLLKKRNIVPENRLNSGCEICLNVLAESNNPIWDVHRLVAENFLETPKEKGYVVHHIDNNSYNNNVTNLIYLKAEIHQGKHKIFHPMSRK